MPITALLLPALLVALLAGTAATVYHHRVHRRRLVRAAGIRTLAGMRWREFSHFVITALQAQGFDAHPLSDTGVSRDPADLLLTRDSQSWLLSCRQSADYVITGTQVQEMQDAVRRRAAAGGVIATLGAIDRSALPAPQGVELVDGNGLWPLIAPLLPAGLHEHLEEQAQVRGKRWLALAWAGALAAGLAAAALAWAIGQATPVTPEAPAPRAAPVGSTPPAAAPEPPVAPAEAPVDRPAAPGDGTDAERQRVLDAIARLPRVQSASWASRSTLLVVLGPGDEDLRPAVCAVLERQEALRASRVQLQPAPGGNELVRFFHCRLY